jgi:hypothetical protein
MALQLPDPRTMPPVISIPSMNITVLNPLYPGYSLAGGQAATSFTSYCTDLFQYYATCIKGPEEIKKYCTIEGYYCHQNLHFYKLFGLSNLPCNTTLVSGMLPNNGIHQTFEFRDFNLISLGVHAYDLYFRNAESTIQFSSLITHRSSLIMYHI